MRIFTVTAVLAVFVGARDAGTTRGYGRDESEIRTRAVESREREDDGAGR